MSTQAPAYAVERTAFLKIESGTHSVDIGALLVSSDGKQLVTMAGDKTIRVWDVAGRREVRKIIGQIGPGKIGEIVRIALTPNGRYVLASVRMSDEGESEVGHLRVHDFRTGNLLRVYPMPGILDDIHVSQDGRFLAAACKSQNTFTVYDLAGLPDATELRPVVTISGEAAMFGAALPMRTRIYKHGSEHRIVCSWWNFYGGEHLLTLHAFSAGRGFSAREIARHAETDSASDFLAVGGGRVAACGHHRSVLRVFDSDLRPLGSPVVGEAHPAGAAFARDGRRLIVGTLNDFGRVEVRVFETAGDAPLLRSTYTGHDAKVLAAAFLPDGTAVSAGGLENEIHFWDPSIAEGAKTGEISGVGRKVYAVGLDANRVAFGHRQAYKPNRNNYAPLEHVFDLDALAVRPLTASAAKSFARAAPARSDRSLVIPSDNPNLLLLPAYTWLTGGWGELRLWYFAETFGFTPNGTIVTGDRGGNVRAVSIGADGEHRHTAFLRAHTAAVWDHAVQGKWLATGSADQTIRLWHVPDVEAAAGGHLDPALSLFVGKPPAEGAEPEWVLWSESGFYASSQNGDDYIGFHVNQGDEQEAEFYPADRFLGHLYRPDIIRLILDTGSEARALARINESGTDCVVPEIVRLLPPVVEMHGKDPVRVDGQTAVVVFEVRRRDEDVQRVWALCNDRPVWEIREGIAAGGVFNGAVPLEPGDNRIKILAENRHAKSNPAVWVIEPDGPAPAPDPADAAPAPGAPPLGAAPADEAPLGESILIPDTGGGGGPPPAPAPRLASLAVEFDFDAAGAAPSVWVVRDGRVLEHVPPAAGAGSNRVTVRVPIADEGGEFDVRAGVGPESAVDGAESVLSLRLPSREQAALKLDDGDGKGQGDAPTAGALQDSQGFTRIDPVLFLLAVGVSNLLKPAPQVGLDNLKYAHEDAIAIAAAFRAQKGPLYNAVHIELLTNEQATLAEIKAALARLNAAVAQREADKLANRQVSRDITLVFLSGHGVVRPKFGGDLYFWNHDFDLENAKDTGLRFLELGEMITALPTEVVLLLDTCESGRTGSDLIRGIDPSELSKRLIDINERAQYILTSSRKDAKSWEHDALGHGVFTYCILDAFKKALTPEVRLLWLADYVQSEVSRLSKSRQESTARVYGDILSLCVYKRSALPART